jgi:2-methylisocitrate lyase-like PEP mutase family enzyme
MKRTLTDLLATHPLPVVAPGVFDGLSAQIVAQAGFPAVYASGGAISRSTGLPDLGLLSMTEVRDRVAQICSAGPDVAVIADIDTGYGNALNVHRTVEQFLGAGVSALQLEDQSTPKKCGHYAGKDLISAAEMAAKLAAAREALAGAPTTLIARTDAIAVEGLQAAIDRSRRYQDAGADVLFVEAPETIEQIEQIAEALRGSVLLLNMFEGGRTPRVALPRLAELGYQIVIIPSDLQRAALQAMTQTALAIRRDGDSHSLAATTATFDHRDAVVGKAVWDQREERAAVLAGDGGSR